MTSRIATIPPLPEIPIVVLTAAGLSGITGAVEILRKPIDLGILVDTVERHASGSH